MSNFHQEITPEKVHLYFADTMLLGIHDTVKQQIITKEVKNLAVGTGMFILDALNTKDRGEFHIALQVSWRYDVEKKHFDTFIPLKYHLYTGELPDIVLDEINDLQKQGPAEWKHNDN